MILNEILNYFFECIIERALSIFNFAFVRLSLASENETLSFTRGAMILNIPVALINSEMGNATTLHLTFLFSKMTYPIGWSLLEQSRGAQV